MKKIALVCCDNGLGHTRRVLVIAESLVSHGAKVTVFGKQSLIFKFKETADLSKFQLVDYISNTNAKNLTNGSNDLSLNFNMPDLDAFDCVLSDNLIEILRIRPDAWISGSFFWHRALCRVAKKYYEDCETLLRLNKPKVVSTEFFSADYLTKISELKEVGFVDWHTKKPKSNKKKNSLLISLGLGHDLGRATLKALEDLISIATDKFDRVYVEPAIYHQKLGTNVLAASYSPHMYSEVKLAIIRPGAGTVTQCIKHDIYILAFYEPSNLEMAWNAQKIDFDELGKNIGVLDKQRISTVATNLHFFKKAEPSLEKKRKYSWDGANEIASLMLTD